MTVQTSSIAVVGNGIAGAATCLALANRGLAVTWIAPERQTSGAKPGESLAAAAEPLLASLNADALLAKQAHRRMETSFSSWGSAVLLERSAIATLNGLGTVVDRVAFENDLEGLATEADIRVVRGSLENFTYGDAGWDLLTSGGEGLRASFLVDATGRRALIGRRMEVMRREDRLVAAYAFLPHVDPEVEPTHATLIEAVEDGWWYATLLNDGRLAVNYYSDPDLMPRGLTQSPEAWRRLIGQSRYISKWIETGGFSAEEAPSLASAGTTWLEKAAGQGWIAVGDAAAAFDPLSAHGMTTALWSGIQAAAAADACIRGETGALDAYSARVNKGIVTFLEDRRRMYGREVRFSNRLFWKRRAESTSFVKVSGKTTVEDPFGGTTKSKSELSKHSFA